ncbi:rhodanese-like domain-containing protein [Actinomadura madurae]|uniref:rhodanese-like domain-containing protein n=1 Tax=Actinomadura madurae TaxID=1993 RepID=UPI002026227A|nr:rhodanese-like domain-containing protein [Actinomadura madurae]MCP9952145.1 rhodanese-like domain-containing protein [Actinomadura madurae]MCP9968901.1 rhodanese-like domain-containing protein [Actinomadura madurae]MCP9981378.1 rhodanese-like domain-containing protein [Actinomadura madurae]MCQ0007114.1 rhodanese-like domain-containing protein [Actinomadura madurae]MCQ0017578.1 rhodanese-like domain-containing protein [Actinomadura madurae]
MPLPLDVRSTEDRSRTQSNDPSDDPSNEEPALATVPAPETAPAATADEARRHFAARLAFETDVSDVAAALAAGTPDLVVVDTRSAESWVQGHVQGAVHLPTAEIAGRAAALVPEDATVVVYCWGPGCNGAQKAALEFAELGRPVKEMLGGFEYWAREGLPVETGGGVVTRRSPDPLTAPVTGVSCAC